MINVDANTYNDKTTINNISAEGAHLISLDFDLYVIYKDTACCDCKKVVMKKFNEQTRVFDFCTYLRHRRSKFAACAFNGKIYVAGGEIHTEGVNKTKSVESYDPSIDQWKTEPCLPEDVLDGDLNVQNGSLYLCSSNKTIMKLNLKRNAWGYVYKKGNNLYGNSYNNSVDQLNMHDDEDYYDEDEY